MLSYNKNVYVTFAEFKIIFLHIMKIFIEVVEQNSERLDKLNVHIIGAYP